MHTNRMLYHSTTLQYNHNVWHGSYACLLTLRPTSLTFLPFTPLPVSFAQVLTTLSSVVHLSVQYPMVKGLSHIPPLLLGTLFLSRSALLIKSLLSDPELKHTFSVLPTSRGDWWVVIYTACKSLAKWWGMFLGTSHFDLEGWQKNPPVGFFRERTPPWNYK